jgi:uncharacterized protein (TIGR03067 family)
MFRPTLALVVLLLSVVQARPGNALDPLQGTWLPLDGTFDGVAAPAEVLKDRQWVIRGDQLEEIVKGRRENRATLKVDTTPKNWAIDVTYTEGQARGLSGTGIYQMDKSGDTLVVCLMLPGERPTEFTAMRGSGRALLVFKRAK